MIDDCENKGYSSLKWNSNPGYTTVVFPGVTINAKTDNAVNDTVSDALIDAVKTIIKKAFAGELKTENAVAL